jgi:hypothetical protein
VYLCGALPEDDAGLVCSFARLSVSKVARNGFFETGRALFAPEDWPPGDVALFRKGLLEERATPELGECRRSACKEMLEGREIVQDEMLEI